MSNSPAKAETTVKPNRWAPVLCLAVLCALPAMGSAQSVIVDVSQVRYETTLIIDARSLQAQVRADGRPMGSAGELLVTIAISVTPEPHIVEISAPGFHRYVGKFIADAGGAANQFVVALAPR